MTLVRRKGDRYGRARNSCAVRYGRFEAIVLQPARPVLSP